jgi:hypothetical protein
MSSEFPFLKVMPEMKSLVGKRQPGTRIYRREGTYEEAGQQSVALDEVFNDSFVSPGGVIMFVPVSRAAFYKRMNEGRLTVFCFHVVKDEKTFFGKVRKAKSTPFVWIPVSELQAWAKEIKEKRGEAEARKEGDFDIDGLLDRDPDDNGRKDVVYGERMTREEIMHEIQSGIRFAIKEILGKLLPGKLGEKHREEIMSGLFYNYKTKKWTWGDKRKNREEK